MEPESLQWGIDMEDNKTRIELFKNPEFRVFFKKFLFVSLTMILLIIFFILIENNLMAIISLIIGVAVQIICIGRYVHYIYKRIHLLIFGVESIVSGNFNCNLVENQEGELSILGFQLNQVAKRMKLNYEELENQKESLKRWTSDISHQLKTPLAVIKMFSEIIEKEVKCSKEIDTKMLSEVLDKNLKQIDGMESLIQALLKISRLESGKVKINKENMDIKNTLCEVIENLDEQIKQKKQNIKISLPSNEIYIFHDVEWMKEAIKNIIKNAIDYTDEGEEIDVALIEMKEVIKITIKDSGMGIAMEEVPHIFERFYRGKKSNKKSNGAGIGLALSKFIIEKHGGFIRVDSEIGKGTMFSVVLKK